MITDKELAQRINFYRHSYHELSAIHGVSPSYSEMVMYVALMLKEDPIELSIKLLELSQEDRKQERYAQHLDAIGETVGPVPF